MSRIQALSSNLSNTQSQQSVHEDCLLEYANEDMHFPYGPGVIERLPTYDSMKSSMSRAGKTVSFQEMTFDDVDDVLDSFDFQFEGANFLLGKGFQRNRRGDLIGQPL